MGGSPHPKEPETAAETRCAAGHPGAKWTRLCELPSRQTKQGHTIGHMTTGPTREENKSGRPPTAGPGADRWVQRQEAGSSDQTTPKQETAGKPSIKPCSLKSPADGPSRSPGAASSAQSCGCRARRRPAPAQGNSSTRRTLDLEQLLVQKLKVSTWRVPEEAGARGWPAGKPATAHLPSP